MFPARLRLSLPRFQCTYEHQSFVQHPCPKNKIIHFCLPLSLYIIYFLFTSSVVTGFWLVFLNSSIFAGSSLKSFFVPTNKNGIPGQKCSTSDIHCKQRVRKNKKSARSIVYLFLDIVQCIRGINRETDKDDMRIRIG